GPRAALRGADCFLQRPACEESQHALRRDLHRFAGHRIAPDARRTIAHLELAEGRQLNFVSALENICYLIEHAREEFVHLPARKLELLSEFSYQFRFSHSILSLDLGSEESRITSFYTRKYVKILLAPAIFAREDAAGVQSLGP